MAAISVLAMSGCASYVKRAEFDSAIAELRATDASMLSEEYKPLLDDFAKIVCGSHSDALITVEGFADPSGSSPYNRRLGQHRTGAVRNYLVQTGGLSAEQVRAVSYGEDCNRQVRAGASGDAGKDNRRVSLVVDYVGSAAAFSSATM